MSASLYLIPVTIAETDIDRVLPAYNRYVILQIKHFIIENERTARRFLKKVDPSISIEGLHFYVLNRHTSKEELSGFLRPIENGEHVGLLSEAGCPTIADPGADIVAIAQKKSIPIVALVGPCSILLALMASGLNGQCFAFHGYLPIEKEVRIKKLKQLEQSICKEYQTQIFMETPYRNNRLLDDILNTCLPSTILCIAADVTGESEYIKTRNIASWKRHKPDLSKRPCLFLLGMNKGPKYSQYHISN